MAQTPDQIAAKWAQNLGGATQRITDGVNSVTVAPGQAAARQKAVYLANVTANVDKWATNTAKVPLSDWQQAMVNKGVQRIATGATAAQPQFQQFMTQLLPAIDQAKSTLPARGNLQQNIQRMTQFVTAMSKFRYNK